VAEADRAQDLPIDVHLKTKDCQTAYCSMVSSVPSDRTRSRGNGAKFLSTALKVLPRGKTAVQSGQGKTRIKKSAFLFRISFANLTRANRYWGCT
jgi:hypothetical protein